MIKKKVKRGVKRKKGLDVDKSIRKAAKREPVWKGPEVDGITQSLLSRYLVCKERFRVYAIEGWAPHDRLNVPLFYGDMWHECEEALAAGEDWKARLKHVAQKELLKRKHIPPDRDAVEKYYHACKRQFPNYVKFWEEHPDVKDRKPLLQEVSFKVPYELPSGRKVLLRGKWDSVDLIGKGKRAGIWLQENKTKGRIDEEFLRQQLHFDLQTMLYLVALSDHMRKAKPIGGRANYQPVGVRYNVIRRPFSGLGDIKRKEGDGRKRDWEEYIGPMGGLGWQHKETGKIKRNATKNPGIGETLEEYYDRLEQYFIDDPETWFMRWNVEITQQDIENFKTQFLDPCLEELCLWYDYITKKPIKQTMSRLNSQFFLHYRLPYGVFNPILEGKKGSDVEEFILTGSTAGLRKITNLFPELD